MVIKYFGYIFENMDASLDMLAKNDLTTQHYSGVNLVISVLSYDV